MLLRLWAGGAASPKKRRRPSLKAPRAGPTYRDWQSPSQTPKAFSTAQRLKIGVGPNAGCASLPGAGANRRLQQTLFWGRGGRAYLPLLQLKRPLKADPTRPDPAQQPGPALATRGVHLAGCTRAQQNRLPRRGNGTTPPELDYPCENFTSEGPEMNENHAPSFFLFFRK